MAPRAPSRTITKLVATRVTAVALVALFGVTACSGGTNSGSSSASTLTATTVVENLAAPWSIAFYQGTALVSERDTGRVLELDDQGVAREVTVVGEATARREGGLLGIAVRGNYLYAYHTTANDNRIARYPLQGTPGSLSVGTGETILEGIPAASYHDGGRIAFGPDGMLYATTGDAGNTANSQDSKSLAGKILRMTPEGKVPADNPFPGSLVYSHRHRNPQGIGWDAQGTMHAAEFGENTWDELNVIEAGGNYGWPEAEGIGDNDAYINPVQQWNTNDASPSGLAVTEESIFIAALGGRRLIEVPLGDLGSSTEHFTNEYGRLRDAVITPEGDLWVLTNNTDGRGDPAAGDDRILLVEQPATTSTNQ